LDDKDPLTEDVVAKIVAASKAIAPANTTKASGTR